MFLELKMSVFLFHVISCGLCFKLSMKTENSQNPISLRDLDNNNIKTGIRTIPIFLGGIVLSTVIKAEPIHAEVFESSIPLGPKKAIRPLVYSVEMTDPPSLQPRTTKGEVGAIARFADADIVLLGEHHSSELDHTLQASIISRMLEAMKKNKKELVIGLEMVQKGNPAFQDALDVYITSKKVGVSLDDADTALIKGVDWLNRWVWDFNVYKPVFHLAREKGIKLVALNVLSETQQSVKELGLDGLSDVEKQIYVPDGQGFVDSVKGKYYSNYFLSAITTTISTIIVNGQFTVTNIKMILALK